MCDYSFGIISERIVTRVREVLFSKMLQLDVAWYVDVFK
jgi:hypothetical protein